MSFEHNLGSHPSGRPSDDIDEGRSLFMNLVGEICALLGAASPPDDSTPSDQPLGAQIELNGQRFLLEHDPSVSGRERWITMYSSFGEVPDIGSEQLLASLMATNLVLARMGGGVLALDEPTRHVLHVMSAPLAQASARDVLDLLGRIKDVWSAGSVAPLVGQAG